MDSAIRNISPAETQTEVVGVYVMQDDAAQTLTDAAGYQFGVTTAVDKENTDKTEEVYGTDDQSGDSDESSQ